MNNRHIYLDHNASTPIDPEVLETVIQISRDLYANPSSIEHRGGSAARKSIEEARIQIGTTIGCRATEIIFTSGSTEANNLAIIGSFPELKKNDRTHLITSQIEHPSVLACFDVLERQGAQVTRLSVNEEGVISLEEFKSAITTNTGFVSIMAANNETGVLQPIHKIGAICEEHDIIFHTDYSQASAYIPLDLSQSPIHLASFSGHKAYGPKGVGALYRSLRKPRVKLTPVLHGGGQEMGLRSGTMNTAGIAGLGHAFSIIEERIHNDAVHIGSLRDQLQDILQKSEGVQINGSNVARLPNTISLSITNIEPLALMHELRENLTFSASSACATDKVQTSHVLLAMFGESVRARTAFRLGLGRISNPSEILQVANMITAACIKLRKRKI
ncbi:MAG: cysteine desulfurase DndA [Alphaproteobacteria bacterium]|nr:MAG: cysteine desulfurase DndA [Alphaproteobacteria bacterium]